MASRPKSAYSERNPPKSTLILTVSDLSSCYKRLIKEDFFILSSGFAGEILQKYVNYGGRIAIYGDYSHYTSKPLHDFIYESNKGHDVFFVATEDEAIKCLC